MVFGNVGVDLLKCSKDMQTSDYLDVLFVLGSLSVITQATRVTDHTFSLTGHIHTNKPEKVVKLVFNWSSFRSPFWCCFAFC